MSDKVELNDDGNIDLETKTRNQDNLRENDINKIVKLNLETHLCITYAKKFIENRNSVYFH